MFVGRGKESKWAIRSFRVFNWKKLIKCFHCFDFLVFPKTDKQPSLSLGIYNQEKYFNQIKKKLCKLFASV